MFTFLDLFRERKYGTSEYFDDDDVDPMETPRPTPSVNFMKLDFATRANVVAAMDLKFQRYPEFQKYFVGTEEQIHAARQTFVADTMARKQGNMKMGVGLGGKPPESGNNGGQAPPLENKLHLEADLGLETPRSIDGPSLSHRIYEGIDWHFIWRVSHAQFFLSMISSLCLLISLHFTGFNVFRFTSSAWATYLACVAVVGIRAGRYRNYSYLVAFTGMVTFQTVIYMSSLCWLAYSLYALDYHVNYAFRGHGYAIISHDLAMGLIIIEIVALLCTIFTGFFGLVTVCRGLGAMMQEIEALIMDARSPPPQITVRPLV